jgi:hypothetical protein
MKAVAVDGAAILYMRGHADKPQGSSKFTDGRPSHTNLPVPVTARLFGDNRPAVNATLAWPAASAVDGAGTVEHLPITGKDIGIRKVSGGHHPPRWAGNGCE